MARGDVPDRRLLGRLPGAAARRVRAPGADRDPRQRRRDDRARLRALFPSTRIDAVELDGELTDDRRAVLRLSGPRLRSSASRRSAVAGGQAAARYGAIFLDAYRQPYIPFYLITREFFALVRDTLRPGGAMIINVGHPTDSDALEKVLSATLRTGSRCRARPERVDQLAGDRQRRSAVRGTDRHGRKQRRALARSRPARRQSRRAATWPPRCRGGRSTPTTGRRSSGSPTSGSCATRQALAELGAASAHELHRRTKPLAGLGARGGVRCAARRGSVILPLVSGSTGSCACSKIVGISRTCASSRVRRVGSGMPPVTLTDNLPLRCYQRVLSSSPKHRDCLDRMRVRASETEARESGHDTTHDSAARRELRPRPSNLRGYRLGRTRRSQR